MKYPARLSLNKYILISVVILFLAGCYGLYLVSKSRTFQFFGGLTDRVFTDKKVVALTFDDAPTDYTADVINILTAKHVKATFYLIGQQIEKYPGQTAMIAKAGMEIGNHSYSHQRMVLKSQAYIDSEISKTSNLIRSSGYSGEVTFRPPNGKKLIGLPWYLSRRGIKTIMWDVEPDTYAPRTKNTGEKTDFLVNYTLSHVRPGSIILLHPFCDTCISDRNAIAPIIDGLEKQGYKLVTVTQLLSLKKP